MAKVEAKVIIDILWFSRHKMTPEQYTALESKFGFIRVTQVNGSPANVHVSFEAKSPEKGDGIDANYILEGQQPPLKELIKGFDEAAVVLPVNMLQQLLPFSNGRLLQALNARVVGNDGRATFVFDKWQAVKEVKIVTEDL